MIATSHFLLAIILSETNENKKISISTANRYAAIDKFIDQKMDRPDQAKKNSKKIVPYETERLNNNIDKCLLLCLYMFSGIGDFLS